MIKTSVFDATKLGSDCVDCDDAKPCTDCAETKEFNYQIAIVESPPQDLSEEDVAGIMLDDDDSIIEDTLNPTIVKQPFGSTEITPTKIDDPNAIPATTKAETAYVEINLPDSDSPEEVAAKQQMQKVLMWGIGAVVLLIVILVLVKMFKKKK